MPQTTQSSSGVSLNETGKDLTIREPEAEDTLSLLLSLFDGMNNLCEKLSRLDYVIKRRNMEQMLHSIHEGEKSEN